MTSQSEADTLTAKVLPHHRKVGPCFTRPAYRDGRIKKAVKVYTISSESSYLLFFGLPSINLEHSLKERCKRFGSVELIRKLLDYPEKELFTDVFLVKLDSVQSARKAKRCLDDTNFYGGTLHVCYAPEYETVAECRVKLHICRRDNARIARKAEFEYTRHLAGLDSHNVSVSDVATDPSDTTNAVLPISSSLDSVVRATCSPAIALSHPCCAEDDARQYWASKGASFVHSLTSPAVSVDPNPCYGAQSQSRSNSQGASNPIRPVPLPVLQALSWRPYSEKPIPDKPTTPAQTEPVSFSQPTLSTHMTSFSNQFIPRCLRTRTSNTNTQMKSTQKPTTSGASSALTLGDLKQLALTLHAEQGPRILPHSYPKPSASCPKRAIVFHRPEAKRQRLSNPSESSVLCSKPGTP